MGINTGKNRDWIGTWFVLAKERGFQTEIVFGSAGEQPNEIHWQKYSHAEFDGVGLAINYFRNLGLNPIVPTLPEKYHSDFFSRLMGVLRGLRFSPVKAAKWKRVDEAKLADKSYGEYVYKILSTEETALVLKHTKAAGVTVTSHLLWALGRAIKNEIIEGSGPHYWMIPVNMRGAVNRPTDTCNQESWVWVDTLKADGAKDIQAQMLKRFAESFHWGGWFTINIGKWIGLKGMNWVLSQAEHVKENWVGVFSNLGSWKINSGPVVFVAPIAPAAPLSAGCATVNGRMALSLHIHPALEVSTSELNGWLDQWMKLVTRPKGWDDSAAKCPETGVAESLSPRVFNQV